MAENVMDQILAELKTSARDHYPSASELRNIRIVGHTPKSDHYIYDVVVDFAEDSERLAAKVYRSNRGGTQVARNWPARNCRICSTYSKSSRRKS